MNGLVKGRPLLVGGLCPPPLNPALLMVRLILAELGVTEVSVQLAEADSCSDRDGVHVVSAAASLTFHEREILGRHQAT